MKDLFELIDNEHDYSSSFTIKSDKPKQEVDSLIEKAKDYELMSLQLQNEIIDHRKYLKDNYDKMIKNLEDYEECKVKIKKREHKIDKLRKQVKALTKDKTDQQ